MQKGTMEVIWGKNRGANLESRGFVIKQLSMLFC